LYQILLKVNNCFNVMNNSIELLSSNFESKNLDFDNSKKII